MDNTIYLILFKDLFLYNCFVIQNNVKGFCIMIVLSDIASVKNGLSISRKRADENFEHSFFYKQISLRCFDSGVKLNLDGLDAFYATEEIDSRYITSHEDIVIRLRTPINAVYIEKGSEGLLVSSLLAIIRVDKNLIYSKYLAYYLNSLFVKRKFHNLTKGTTIPMLKIQDIKDLQIVLPDIEKQKRIVEFMESADREIDLLEDIITEKKKFSQAILDKIIDKEIF